MGLRYVSSTKLEIRLRVHAESGSVRPGQPLPRAAAFNAPSKPTHRARLRRPTRHRPSSYATGSIKLERAQ
jgi:hypothetical protein